MKKLVRVTIEKYTRVRFESLDLENKIMNKLHNQNKNFNYMEFAEILNHLVSLKFIKPIKSSKKNTMYPPIYNRYAKVIDTQNKLDTDQLIFHPKIKINYFRNHKDEFLQAKTKIDCINKYLLSGDSSILTVNERSYELFKDEKFLASRKGQSLLSKLGLTLEDLNCEAAYEPFFSYKIPNVAIENILIVENKDIFHSIKKLMQEGLNSWDGIGFQMLIYGEGNKISRSIQYLEELNIDKNVKVYYFGDLDLEGIAIKNRMEKRTEYKINWMVFFYKKMWTLRDEIKSKTEQRENKEALKNFLSIFEEEDLRRNIKEYLLEKKYVPQEVINQKRLREWSD